MEGVGAAIMIKHAASMVYIKSIIAGVLALLLVVALMALMATIVLVALSVSGLGIDMVRWHLGSPFFWPPAIAIFSAGFLWKYRRLSK
jgi:hypothetical protein